MTRRAKRAGAAVGAVVVAAAVLWAVFGPAAEWLIGPDLAVLTAKDRADVLTESRVFLAIVLGVTVAVIAVIAVVIAAFGSAADRTSTRQIDGAVAHLASEHLIVRAGGVWALEAVLHDFPRRRARVLASLSLFIRGVRRDPDTSAGPAGAPEDLSAAMSVLRRRDRAHEPDDLDLHGADLRGVDLAGMDLRGADLTHATLTGADLSRADLHAARLTRATLLNATLTQTDLREAELTDADATGTTFDAAQLGQADLSGTTLRRADLHTAVGLTADQLRRALVGRDTRLPPDLLEQVQRDQGW